MDAVAATGLTIIFPGLDPKGPPLKALDGLTLNAARGTLTALVGPDGAGKTTLMRMICGLYPPDGGTLTVLGLDVKKDAQLIQDRISYMPQRFGLYEDLSVKENFELYADLHGVKRKQRQERFERLMRITDLARFTDRPAGKLSGGMKQKLGLACTLVRSPDLLLLDEPSAGVDPLSRRDLWIIIEQLVREEQLTVLISTSYMEEAERCSSVNIVYQGRVLKSLTPGAMAALASGLTYEVIPPPGLKARALQSSLLDMKGRIADAVPQGESVRFIICHGAAPLTPADLPEGCTLKARPATLEDGFMLTLHEAKSADSSASGTDSVSMSHFKVKTFSAEDSGPVIKVSNLVRRFGNFTAVASTSFEVSRGEVFGLLGPNGAGKTTTFRMLCGLLPATSGSLEVAGMNLRKAPALARARIGYVAQKFSLYSNLTVEENLTFFGGAYGLRGDELTKRIRESLKQFELKAGAKSGDLPGGFKQRLSMAAALLHQPEIVFLDEPTSGIDPLARRSFWYTINELSTKGVTIIITTHFMEEAEYCDRIVIQDAGNILALGTPHEVRTLAGSAGTDMNSAFIAIVEQSRAQRREVQ